MRRDGGPAFPAESIPTGDGGRKPAPYSGMTMRDWFATHATEADIAALRDSVPMVDEVRNNFGPGPAFTVSCVEPENWRQVARYLHADMMLKARQS